MLEPKTFYRDFDNLLRQIRHQKADENFLFSIFEAVQHNFAETIKLGHIRLYQERNDAFVFLHDFDIVDGPDFVDRFATSDEAVQKVLKHGSFIYDEQRNVFLQTKTFDYHATPAAILIRSPEQRWIAVFELLTGWLREEVIFSLNAIRTAINQRLFSEAINTELEQAAEIQTSLLPQVPPNFPGYEVAARSCPTEIVGGDLYDFFDFDGEIHGVCIGDASGHGLPAALLARDVVTGLRMGLEKHMKMVHTLQKLNSVIYRSTFSSRFISLFYAEFEKEGNLIFTNAGHPAPFVIHNNKIHDLNATGLILGAIPDIKLHRSYAHMLPGSVLVLFSDGLFERENPNEEIYTINRLKSCARKHQNKSAEDLIEAIFAEVDRFGAGTKWEDDSTLVVIKRLHTPTTSLP